MKVYFRGCGRNVTMLEGSHAWPARPYDRRSMQMNTLWWWEVAGWNKCCGILIYRLITKCIILKHKFVLFRVKDHSEESRSRRLYEKHANSLDTHRYFSFYRRKAGHANCTKSFMSSLPQMTLVLWYKGKSVNAACANNRFLFWNPYKTRKCIVWAAYNIYWCYSRWYIYVKLGLKCRVAASAYSVAYSKRRT